MSVTWVIRTADGTSWWTGRGLSDDPADAETFDSREKAEGALRIARQHSGYRELEVVEA